MIFDVRLEVLGQMIDPSTEQRDLYLGRARIRLVTTVRLHDLQGSTLRCCHSSSDLSSLNSLPNTRFSAWQGEVRR
jgi:hypothetical protein